MATFSLREVGTWKNRSLIWQLFVFESYSKRKINLSSDDSFPEKTREIDRLSSQLYKVFVRKVESSLIKEGLSYNMKHCKTSRKSAIKDQFLRNNQLMKAKQFSIWSLCMLWHLDTRFESVYCWWWFQFLVYDENFALQGSIYGDSFWIITTTSFQKRRIFPFSIN